MCAGLVTARQLRGPRFRSLLRDVFVAADVPDTFLLRCEAAAVATGAVDGPDAVPSAGGRVALAGWAAAEMLGADCAPRRTPVEILVTDGHRRSRPDLVVHHRRSLPGEIVTGVRIPAPGRRRGFVPGRTVVTTSPLRTAFDLARAAERTEAVIALDALSRVGGFAPAEVLTVAQRLPGGRGSRRLPGLVDLADPRAESPMETRVRLALHDHGVRAPVLQHPVGGYRIDLAYPDERFGIEYDGADHLDPGRARADLARQAVLTAAGWELFRPPAALVLGRPDLLAYEVAVRLEARRGPAAR